MLTAESASTCPVLAAQGCNVEQRSYLIKGVFYQGRRTMVPVTDTIKLYINGVEDLAFLPLSRKATPLQILIRLSNILTPKSLCTVCYVVSGGLELEELYIFEQRNNTLTSPDAARF